MMRRLYYAVVKGLYANEILFLLIGTGVAVVLALVALIYPSLAVHLVGLSVALGVTMIALVGFLVTRVGAKVQDLLYGVSFAFLHQGRPPAPDLFMEGAAANPSLMLFVHKVLRVCEPKSILELGSGQTTKILAAYCHASADAAVLTLEEDAGWHERLGSQIEMSKRHDYRFVPLELRRFGAAGETVESYWYGVGPSFRTKRFDFIVVDGPDGPTPHNRYARGGFIEFLPEILMEKFVVVFDDAERYGERTSIRALERSLQAAGRKTTKFAVHGVKTQMVLCSRNWSFLRSI